MMKIEDFLSRLQKVAKTQEGWTACCPAHDDDKPSLTVSKGADGRILVKCHANRGCAEQDICKALGLEVKELFPVPRAGTYTGPLVAAYDYEDAEGKLLYQVRRFEGKVFKMCRPDPENPEDVIWNVKNVPRVPYRLPGLVTAIAQQRPVVIVEGEQDADSMVDRLGLAATCNAGGAGKWPASFSQYLSGAPQVVIVADKDEPGRKHAHQVESRIRGVVNRLVTVELPDRAGHPVKDASDWIAAGGTMDELQQIVQDTAAKAEHKPPDRKAKPEVILPGGEFTVSQAATALGELLGKTESYYLRAGQVVSLSEQGEDSTTLRDVHPLELVTAFESVARLVKVSKRKDSTEFKPAVCPGTTAQSIYQAPIFRRSLPRIALITPCPVITEKADEVVVVRGYDRDLRVLAGGEMPIDMDVGEAQKLLRGLLVDFRFTSPGDEARALAAFITPALVFGGLLRGRAPMDLCEANESQAGKGYRAKLLAAIYNQQVVTITQKKSGIGGLGEMITSALIRGRNFVCIDNVRGRIDVTLLESVLTEECFMVRGAYMPETEMDPRKSIIMMTSNKADLTMDLLKRSSCVLIQKGLQAREWKSFPEGDVLDHVRANQPLYLGAVFSVIRHWFDNGKPKSSETRHDFREWARVLDWIVQNVFKTCALLEGHEQVLQRITTPALNWLRDVALAVIKAGEDGRWLRVARIVELIRDEPDIELPGLVGDRAMDPGDPARSINGSTGKKLKSCFKHGKSVHVDSMEIERKVAFDEDVKREISSYRFGGPDTVDHGALWEET